MFTDPLFFLVGYPAIFLIALSKGAFGGGLALVGVPMLALVMSPVEAAIVVMPLITLMDLFALRSFGPASWSKPDLLWLVPGLLAGIAAGYAFFEFVDPRIVALAIGAVTLAFVADFFLRRRRAAGGVRPVSPPLALLAGWASGFTSFIAHAGGPPANMYLLYRGLEKSVYAATNLAMFMVGNFLKLIPYGLLIWAEPWTLVAAAFLAPAVPAGVWLGKWMHDRLEQQRLFFWCYALLSGAAAKLFYDAATALLA
jgi:uncharacterized membrane protein YfcA